MRDSYLEKLLVETGEALGVVEKERVYINDESEAPEGVDVQQGEQGGLYYETGGGSRGGDGDGGGGEGGGGASLDELGDDYLGALDTPEEQEAAQAVVSELGEAGLEYIGEALHQDSDAFDGMSPEEAVSDAETYAEAAGLDVGGGAEGGDGGDGGDNLDQVDEPYRDVLDTPEEQEAANAVIDELGDMGVEYVEEALHQNGEALAGMSPEEAVEDAQMYAEYAGE